MSAMCPRCKHPRIVCACETVPFIYRGSLRTRRDRINRLRERLNAAGTLEQLRSMMQGLLDLLGDEL